MQHLKHDFRMTIDSDLPNQYEIFIYETQHSVVGNILICKTNCLDDKHTMSILKDEQLTIEEKSGCQIDNIIILHATNEVIY